jgi:hypothetical protein
MFFMSSVFRIPSVQEDLTIHIRIQFLGRVPESYFSFASTVFASSSTSFTSPE